MIRHITGTILRTENTAIILDVKGVGYLVYVSKPTEWTIGETISLNTHHAIRETASDLYGFATIDELEVFELLLSLPKIGPKSAAQIMSQTDLELLTTAITNNDPAHLTKMAGIGKKTAEKIVTGLKDDFAERGAGAFSEDMAPKGSWQSDAIDALISLGYPHSEARASVAKLPPHVKDANEAIKSALKELGQS